MPAPTLEPSIAAALDEKMRRRETGGGYSTPPLEAVSERLVAHLRRTRPGPFRIADLRPLTGGASKEQYRFTLEESGTTRTLMLRCEPGTSIVETPRLREVQLMRVFRGLVPVPEILFRRPRRH